MDNDDIIEIRGNVQHIPRRDNNRHAETVEFNDIDLAYETVVNNKDKPAVKLAVMTVATHCLIAAFTIYITYLSFQNHSLFSWHPSCMTIGFFLLMAEAIMAVSPDNYIASKLKRQGRIRLHFVLQAGSAAFIFTGFLVIYINKNLHNKNHFHTWHGILGLVTVILVILTSTGGISTLYAVRLKHWMKPSFNKFAHNVIGILTFVFGVLTLILGLYSNWFYKNGSYSAQIICTIVIAMAAIFSLESAMKSGYSRFKTLFMSSYDG